MFVTTVSATVFAIWHGNKPSKVRTDHDVVALYTAVQGLETAVVRLGYPTGTMKELGRFMQPQTIVPAGKTFLVSDYWFNKGDTVQYDAEGREVRRYNGMRILSYAERGSTAAWIARTDTSPEFPLLVTQQDAARRRWTPKELIGDEKAMLTLHDVLDENTLLFSFHEKTNDANIALHLRQLDLKTGTVKELADYDAARDARYIGFDSSNKHVYLTGSIDATKTNEQQVVQIDYADGQRVVLYRSPDILRPVGTNQIVDPSIKKAVVLETSRTGSAVKVLVFGLQDNTFTELPSFLPQGWLDYRQLVGIPRQPAPSLSILNTVTGKSFPFPDTFTERYPGASFLLSLFSFS